MKAKLGERVRIFFGVSEPTCTSSAHVIDEIFERTYNVGDLIGPPLQSMQTITVPSGDAAMVEFKANVPDNYILVDHALSRVERGLVGVQQVEGPHNSEVSDMVVDARGAH